MEKNRNLLLYLYECLLSRGKIKFDQHEDDSVSQLFKQKFEDQQLYKWATLKIVVLKLSEDDQKLPK